MASLELAWHLRLATTDDVAALEQLIPLSVRSLQAAHYSSAQMDAALGPVFGVDRQLIADQTYYVAMADHLIVGCGGWSRRKAQFGGDQHHATSGEDLDPAVDPARIRAFFVHPLWTRRGIGRAILKKCEIDIKAAGFKKIELIATLTGEALYTSSQFQVLERYEVPMSGGLFLPVVRMGKQIRS